MTHRHRLDGIYKRCECPRRQWPKCGHPWHIGLAIDGREYRYSASKLAKKPASYRMTKAEAVELRDRLKVELRDGHTDALPTPATAPLTFGALCEAYLDGHVRTPSRRPKAVREMEYELTAVRRATVLAGAAVPVPLNDRPITLITAADVEFIRRQWRDQARANREAWDARAAENARIRAENATRPKAEQRPERPPDRAVRPPGAKEGEVGINRKLTRLSHIFNWAIDHKFLSATPFRANGRVVVKRNMDAEGHRHRRLEPGEEDRLLAAAGPHLRALIEAALETGCRKGELLSLQWSQVSLDRGVLLLPAAKTKTKTDRPVPITARLRAILEMRCNGPDGQPLGPDAYVFGDECGGRIGDVKTAWRTALKRAGITGLHFHDLRRECGSRLIETPGVSLVDVKEWLGHARVTMTDAYLATTIGRFEETRRRVDLNRNRRTRVAQTAVQAPKTATPTSLPIGANRVH